MKNVLFVLPFFPYPLVSGGHQAIFNGIYAVRNDINAFITYCEYAEYPIPNTKKAFSDKMDGRVRVMPFVLPPRPRRSKVVELLLRLNNKLNKSLNRDAQGKHNDYEDWLSQIMPQNENFLNHINGIIENYNIDIVQCEMLETAHIALSLPANITKYFVEHEIGFVRKQLRLDNNSDSSLSGIAHLGINKAIEVFLLNQFDKVLTLSSIDTAKLEGAGVSKPIHTSFACVNTSTSKEVVSTRYNTLTFVGPEWHPSNKSGLLWFLSNCWEKLNAAEPYYLNIIGRWSEETKRIIENRYKGVKFQGYVEDIKSALSDSIMIVPITIGSGIRMKILEACANGVPVVTTSVGVEGLPLVSERDCFIADTPDGFVGSIIALKNAELRHQFIQSSRNLISEAFSTEALRSNRINLY